MFDANKLRNLNQTEILGVLALRYGSRMYAETGNVNDKELRRATHHLLADALAGYLALRYFESYKVVCDDSNNTPDWIQGNNPCLVDVYIQWSKTSQDIWHLKFPLEFGPNEC